MNNEHTPSKDRKVNTATPARNDGARDLPHERDESADARKAQPREVMRQAASDLAQGQVDTDLHGVPGVEKVAPQSAGTAAGVPAARPKAGH